MEILTLPITLGYKAPTEYDKIQWFRQREAEDEIWNFDHNCLVALISEGIGENRCPTIPEWAAFSLIGGIVAALTKKYLKPSPHGRLEWLPNLEKHLWEILWETVEAKKDSGKLDKDFLAAMLRNFLLREHYCPPDRPYYQSRFVSFWRWMEYPDTYMRSIGNIRLERIKAGRQALLSLPESAVNSVKAVSAHIPTILEIAIGHIEKYYHW